MLSKTPVCSLQMMQRTIQTKEDASSLQEDIDSLVRWSLNWQLPFNVEKCKIMRIGNDKNPQTYYMNEQPLDYVKEEKDLGVVVDNRLKFHKHAASAVKQANGFGFDQTFIHCIGWYYFTPLVYVNGPPTSCIRQWSAHILSTEI